MIVWKHYLEDNNIDICCITETWLKESNIQSKANKEKNRNMESPTVRTEFHKFFEDQYTVITKNRKNQRWRKGHGVIWILVRKKIGKAKKITRKRQDGIMWTEIRCGGRLIYIATVYMVPIGSPYYEQNEIIRQELESDIREYKEQGLVLVLGDFNSRIKNILSIT